MNAVAIVDLGRGPQLSTSRITVQDVLPFYRIDASNDEIRRWIPSLTDDEIGALKDFIREHFDQAVRSEADIKAHHDRLRAAQPAWTRANDDRSIAERRAILLEKIANRKSEKNGGDDSLR